VSILGGLSIVVWPLLVLGLVLALVRSRSATGDGWTLALPAPETLAEVFFVIAVCFVGLALMGFNRDLDLRLQPREVVLVSSMVALVTAYLFEAAWPLLLAVVGISGWWGTQAQLWITEARVRPAVLVTGLGLLALLCVTLGALQARASRGRSRAAAYAVPGLAGVLGITFALSTTSGLLEIERGLLGAPPWDSVPISASLAAIGGGLALALLAAVATRALGPLEALAILLHGVLFAALAVGPPQALVVPSQTRRMWIPAGPDLTDVGMAAAAGFNVLVFLQLVGIMAAGHARRQASMVNLGALFFLVAVVAKYFDWFFAFLNKSLFFVGAGVILLVAGFLLETSRRRMVPRLRR
jgi:hypothetical protein